MTWSHWSAGLGVPVSQAVVGSPSMAADAGRLARDDEAVAPVNVSPIDGPGGSVAGAADGPGVVAPADGPVADALGSAPLSVAEAPLAAAEASGDAGVGVAWLLPPLSRMAAPPPTSTRKRTPTPTINGSGLRPRRAGGTGAPGLAIGVATGRAGVVGNSHCGPLGAGRGAGVGVVSGDAAGRGATTWAGAAARPGVAAGRPAAVRRSPHEMQNVRPAGFARPQTGQVGPVVATDGAADGAAAGSGASAGGAGTIGSGATGATSGVPACSAANSRNAPQLPQKASPAAFGVPHFAQIIPLAFASIGPWSSAA